MTNPFEQRATEFIRIDADFLEVVAPDPVLALFEPVFQKGRLYDGLVKIIGTPGSGKTTIAKLFELPKINLLCREANHDSYKPIIDAVTGCGVIKDGQPAILGCRLPMESEYRDYWELPYPENIRNGLVEGLIQARAIIEWLRHLRQVLDLSFDDIKVIPQNNTLSAFRDIGGPNTDLIWEKAIAVESAIYNIGARLIPPHVNEIEAGVTSPYKPFDVIEQFKVSTRQGQLTLVPLVILDDAHTLHVDQFKDFETWLARREVKLARWLISRLDAEPFEAILEEDEESEHHEPRQQLLNRNREVTTIVMGGSRARRRSFKQMARNMAERYLGRIDTFQRRNIRRLEDLLSEEPANISSSDMQKLVSTVDKDQKNLGISKDRRMGLERLVDDYFIGAKTSDDGADVRLGMLRILMNRYANRVRQTNLFENETDDEPNRPLKVNSGMAEGARFQLLYEYNRPKFFGVDALADGSSQNAELFLHLTSPLISLAETRLIRRRNAMLDARDQHRSIQKQALKIIKDWTFPENKSVRKIVKGIAAECATKTQEPNASLGEGPNAFGIPQQSFNLIFEHHKDLATILKFGCAYNAITVISNYHVKNSAWTLIELGGCASLAYGLTFNRGNFIERDVPSLLRFIKSESQE